MIDLNDERLDELVDAAFAQAMTTVIDRARRAGTPVIVWQDGAIRELPVEEAARRLSTAAKHGAGRMTGEQQPVDE